MTIVNFLKENKELYFVNNYIKFGHKEWVQPQTFDGDDTLFQNERNNIRERILECLPYAQKYEEYRLSPDESDRQIKELFDEYSFKPKKVMKKEFNPQADFLLSDEARERLKKARKTTQGFAKAEHPEDFSFCNDSEPITETTETIKYDLFGNPIYQISRAKVSNLQPLYEDLEVYRFRCLDNKLGIYSGSQSYEPENYNLMRKAGIKTVVDLLGSSQFEKNIKQADLNYFPFPTGQGDFFIKHCAFKNKEQYMQKRAYEYGTVKNKENFEEYLEMESRHFDSEVRNFVDMLIEYIDIVNNGEVYIGCAYATRNTNDALILNNLFNPKTQLLGGNPVEYKKPYFIALYDNLTKQDKERLGITPEFEAEKRATLQPDYNDFYYQDMPWLLN